MQKISELDNIFSIPSDIVKADICSCGKTIYGQQVGDKVENFKDAKGRIMKTCSDCHNEKFKFDTEEYKNMVRISKLLTVSNSVYEVENAINF